MILDMLDGKGNDVKPLKRSRSVFERPDYVELALEMMLEDVKDWLIRALG